MRGEIHCDASSTAQATIDRLGRTEDVRFSPSNRRLAIAAFGADRIVVIDIERPRGAAGAGNIVLGDAIEVEAPALRRPHGLCFIDESTLAVANREGSVQVLELPAPGGPRRAVAAVRQTLHGGADVPIHTPGSVASFPLGAETLELLVCNNYSNRVTRHVLDRRADYAASVDEVALEKRLDVPDGIDLSGDGRWLAISNHNTHSVLLYDRAVPLGPQREPDGVLRNVLCPHGVRFTSDQKHVLVADASAPVVNVYERGAGSWHGRRDPVRLFRVMSDDVFRRGRHNPEEGGPKGIDISGDMGVVAVTSEFQSLAFFDVAEVLRLREAPANRHRRHLQWRVAKTLFKRLGYMPGAGAAGALGAHGAPQTTW